MILYLDTSALVKLYADEAHSDTVREAVGQAEFRGCHIVGYAEACAAIARRARENRVADSELAAKIGELTRDWNDLDVIEATWPLIHKAGQLAVRFGLRGYDSVHLAAAEAVGNRVEGTGDFRFAVFDAALATAARQMGFETLVGDA